MKHLSFRRLRALCWKETLQIFRDPSSNLIAFVLPLLLIFVFGFGINLDTPVLHVGLLKEGTGKDADGLAAALQGTPSMAVRRRVKLEPENPSSSVTRPLRADVT